MYGKRMMTNKRCNYFYCRIFSSGIHLIIIKLVISVPLFIRSKVTHTINSLSITFDISMCTYVSVRCSVLINIYIYIYIRIYTYISNSFMLLKLTSCKC